MDSDVDRVLAYFVNQQPDAGHLAASLMDHGGLVIEASGPVQMAAYHLVLRRGDWDIVFHSERGRGDWVSVGHAAQPQTFRPLGLAVFAWARAHDVPFQVTSPLDLNHDLAAYGIDALDWLAAGNDAAVERLYRVWREARDLIGYSTASMQNEELVAEAVARLEEAAR